MSEETTYHVEHAKSNRAKCKTCKQPIDKDSMKIVVTAPGGDYAIASGYHPDCFTLPRKFKKEQMTVDDFVDSLLEDKSEGGKILSENRDEIVQALLASGDRRKSSSSAAGAQGDEDTFLGRVRKAYEAQEKGEEPAKKKAKKEGKDDDAIPQELIDVYGHYRKCNAKHLGEVLRWNHQHTSGTKPVLLTRILDGERFGRLARCQLCEGGRLKLSDSGLTVTCGGAFDESSQLRIPCSYEAPAEKAPRWQPWYSEEPTEEQKEEMEKLLEDAKEGEGTAEESKETETSTDALVKAVQDIEWPPLKNKANIKKATTNMVQALRDFSGSKLQLDLPSDDEALRMKVGTLIVQGKPETPAELVPTLVKEFGFKEHKERAASKKQAAAEEAAKCPANAPIIAALQELAKLYFKEGNRNAGLSYNKAVGAIQEFEYEITEENAMGLSKGKTKVAGIGKGTAEKIKEFLETGTIAKLEEKRAEADAL